MRPRLCPPDFGGSISAMTDSQCHRVREHVPHVEYEDPGAPFDCPGIGDFSTAWVRPLADPFEGVDEAYENTEW